jgi:hypothetical protein
MRFKFLIAVLAMALSGFALSLYLPWWIIAPCCLLVTILIPLKPASGFAAGFISMFLYWGIMVASISVANHHLLAAKMGNMLFKTNDPWIPVVVTAAMAGLIGGLAALVGSILAYRKPRS